MKNVTRKIWGYRYVILLVLWLLYLINFLDRIAVLTLLPFIQSDLNLTPVEVGQLASVFFFAYGLAQISAGFLADKFGPKKVMSIAILVFTFSTVFTGMIKSFTQFLLLRVGLGIGEGHHFAPASRTINNWFPKAERGRAVSLFLTSGVIATAIAPLLVSSISLYFFDGQWRPIFYLMAIPGVIGIAVLWYFISDTPKQMLEKGKLDQDEYKYIVEGSIQSEEEAGLQDKKEGTNILLKDVNFYIFSLLLFCQQSIYWGATTWLTTFLVKQHGLTLKEMGFFASAPFIVAFFAMILGGWFMDKVTGRMKPVGLIAYLGSIPVLWLLGGVEKGQTGLLLTLLLFVGFFVNLNMGSVYAYLQNRYPNAIVGRATGISNGIGYMGGFVSPLVSGYLVKVGVDGSQNFSHVFIFFAFTAAVAALCTFLLKEQRINVSNQTDFTIGG